MESNKNNDNNNEAGDEHQQLQSSAPKRKFNELANEEDKPAAAGEDQNCGRKKNREEGNDLDMEQIVLLAHEKEEGIAETEQQEQEILPTHKPMKIQLSKETWFDMLEFVPRRRLGQIVPQIGDRQFAGIAQSFLHNYGRITLANIYITGPSHRLIQHDVPMPENVKDFLFINLSYLNTSVINLLQKFQQNSLFGNVNLDMRIMRDGDRNRSIRETLSHLQPLIANLNSIQGGNIAQLVAFDNANSDMAMAMLKMAQFLAIFHDEFQLAPDEIAFLSRWLHTPRDDGTARVLILPIDYDPLHGRSNNKIPLFIDGTKVEFAKAKSPCSFFIRLYIGDAVEWQDSSMENGQTKEKLVVKKVGPEEKVYQQRMALVSRYPLGADKRWIEANERAVMDWEFDEQNGRICLGSAMDNNRHGGNGDDDEDGRDDQGGNRGRFYGDRRGMGRPGGFAKRGGGGGQRRTNRMSAGGRAIRR